MPLYTVTITINIEADSKQEAIENALQSDNIYSSAEQTAPRVCSECGNGMFAGFMVDLGEAYYCTEECLHKHHSKEEWLKMCEDGESDVSYYTEWELEEEDEDED